MERAVRRFRLMSHAALNTQLYDVAIDVPRHFYTRGTYTTADGAGNALFKDHGLGAQNWDSISRRMTTRLEGILDNSAFRRLSGFALRLFNIDPKAAFFGVCNLIGWGFVVW